QRRTVKNLADAPHHALIHHAVTNAEPIPVLQRAFGKTDRARPLADAVGIIEQHNRLTPLRQIDRKRQPDRPGAHHDNEILGRIGASAILIGVAAVAELDFGLRHALTLLWPRDLVPAKIVASATI